MITETLKYEVNGRAWFVLVRGNDPADVERVTRRLCDTGAKRHPELSGVPVIRSYSASTTIDIKSEPPK